MTITFLKSVFKQNLLLVAIVAALPMAFAGTPYREAQTNTGKYALHAGEPISMGSLLLGPSIVVVENAYGPIRIVGMVDSPTATRSGVAGKVMKIKGSYRGATPSTLRVTRADDNRIKIVVEYPKERSRRTSGINISSSGGGMQVSSIGSGVSIVNGKKYSTPGGNISVINGRVYANGVEIRPDDERGNKAETEAESAELEIELPMELVTHLQASSLEGRVSLSGFKGPSSQLELAHLKSESGDVSIRNVSASKGIASEACAGSVCAVRTEANLDLRATNGSIDVVESRGSLHAITSSGSIDVEQVNGNLELLARNGDVSVERSTGDAVAESKNGNIKVSGQEGRAAGETKNGNVTFDNPKATAEFAKTKNGNIRGLRRSIFCQRELIDPSPWRVRGELEIFAF